MTASLHLLRTAVQIPDMHRLHEVQKNHQIATNEGVTVVATTRRMPQRWEQLLDGGSIYWIIKHRIACRQEIRDIQQKDDKAGGSYCQFLLNPQIIKVHPRPKRAFQGWRYLEGWDAPKDIGPFNPDEDGMPEEMEKKLRDLGVL